MPIVASDPSSAFTVASHPVRRNSLVSPEARTASSPRQATRTGGLVVTSEVSLTQSSSIETSIHLRL